MGKSAIVLIHDGTEEMEAVITIDTLRRAGVAVTVTAVESKTVTCSRNVVITADALISEINANTFDCLVLPGGMGGAKFFASNATVQSLIKSFYHDDAKLLAVLCASPIALAAAGIAKDKKITSHPSVKADLEKSGFSKYLDERVVVDENLITSRGPGTSFEFAFAIVTKLVGHAEALSAAQPMILHPSTVLTV